MVSRRLGCIAIIAAVVLVIAMGLWMRSRERAASMKMQELKQRLVQAEAERDEARTTALSKVQPSAQATERTSEPGLIPSAEDGSTGLIERVGQLKRILAINPQWALPEFKFLADEDWIRAAEMMLSDSDSDARYASNLLRQHAKQKFLPQILNAVKEYQSAHGGQWPTSTKDLLPLLDDPISRDVLSRYKIVWGKLGDVTDWMVQEHVLADDYLDSRISAGAGSSLSMIMVSGTTGLMFDTAAQNFRKVHGKEPQTAEELAPFMGHSVDVSQFEFFFYMTKRFPPRAK